MTGMCINHMCLQEKHLFYIKRVREGRERRRDSARGHVCMCVCLFFIHFHIYFHHIWQNGRGPHCRGFRHLRTAWGWVQANLFSHYFLCRDSIRGTRTMESWQQTFWTWGETRRHLLPLLDSYYKYLFLVHVHYVQGTIKFICLSPSLSFSLTPALLNGES
jgi:hypothetical protein